MTIPAAWLDELRARTTLSTVIQRSTPLKKAGREWKACCPFHNEKSPSFTVNDEKGFYHCFGCGSHGDVIRWMTDQQGLTFIDAVKELAAAAGMEVPQSDPRAAERQERRDHSTAIMGRAADLFVDQLMQPQNDAAAQAREYLEQRGIGVASWAKFQIGYAPNSRIGSQPHMLRLNAPAEALEQLGLVKRNPDTGNTYDFFRGRIIIPIHDARGQVIAFGGRIVGPGEPKYLNSPDTPIFDKGRTLFNLHRASPKARATGRLVIVEGYMDVIALAMVGIEEAVAPNGTALTEAQLALAWKLVDEPLVCMDGDKAGKKAALRAALRALPVLAPGKGISFVFPPDGQDPDDVAREGGAAAVDAMLSTRHGIADVLWQEALEQLGDRSPERIARVRRDLRDMIGTIRDSDVRAAYFGDIGRRLDALSQRQQRLPSRPAPARREVNDAVQDALMKGMLSHPRTAWAAAEKLARIGWHKEHHERLLDGIVAIFDESGPDVDFDAEIQRRGLADAALQVRQCETLRFPFLTEQDPNIAAAKLLEAIDATANQQR